MNPFPDRKIFVKEFLKQAINYQNLNQQIKDRAKSITEDISTTPIDALHFASAEQTQVDLFITCDYNLIKKYQGEIKVISPLEFFNYYGNTKD